MTNQSPESNFLSFSLSDEILTAIEETGFEEPTEVQLQAIPPILKGKDVLASAETGSGKTAAFVLPLLHHLTNQNLYLKNDVFKRFDGLERSRGNCVQILILVPTRELTIQIREVFEKMAKDLEPKIRCLSIYGGVKINPQMMALRGGADVLVATPGRLLDLEKQNAIKFDQLKVLVIDEVDRLIKGDFLDEIENILKRLPKKRQNLMFTATFPDSIRMLVRKVLNDPEIINTEDFFEESKIEQRVITVNHDKKNDLLAHLLNVNEWKQVLIFCSAKRTCDNLQKKLEKRGVDTVVMHGNKEQSKRARALRDFKRGDTRVLIATDVAARGIDVEELPCVINYDLPRSPNDYVHRIGRTSRAGSTGVAISLISHEEYHHFKVIEKQNGLKLYREQIKGFEADSIAPPVTPRTRTKKKTKVKNKKSAKK